VNEHNRSRNMRKLNKKSLGLHRYAAKDRAGAETATPMAKRVPLDDAAKGRLI